MNKISSYLRFSALILMIFAANYSFSQDGRLPTKEELEIKMNLENFYRTHPTNIPNAKHLLTTGPEQDCPNATPVCSSSYSQSNSYTGHGGTQEVNGTCLSSKETNSVWYTFTVQNSGTFTFLLNTANDYDFALYNITTIGCSGVPSATPVRCNYSATYGNTGLTLPASNSTNLSVAAGGSPTMPGLNVTAGQTFALIIDNYSANTNGYTLTFGTGTGAAQISDNTPPAFGSLTTPSCGGNTIHLNFSEPVQCSSIDADGSDFTITSPTGTNIPVTSASGNACSGAATTTSATINFSTVGFVSGVYTVTVKTGSDGNTVTDKCGNIMPATESATFQFLAPISIAATATTVCSGSPSTITVSGASGVSGLVYSWAPASGNLNNITVNPTVTSTYVATATYGGCSVSASQTITVNPAPIVSVNPSNVSLCSGTATITATSSFNGATCVNCNYVWTGSASQTDNSVPSSTINNAAVGSYTVTVSSNTGCVGNSAVSNVSILSPSSPPSCNILYASPSASAVISPTANGLTPATPTTIQNAINMAACNSIVIKMQIGDYIINSPLTIASYVTIEGGYNDGINPFSYKTSAKATTGGFPVQGTRIIRNTSNPSGSTVIGDKRLLAFDIPSSTSYFRLQDIRIDMPDNAAGTGISNYGIYLGSNCSNYDIVRCYIYSGNAGSGLSGSTGTTGVTGSDGGSAGNGGNGNSSSGTFGDGGAEAQGAGSAHSAMFWNFGGGASNGTSTIPAEAANGGTRNGGEGGAGGCGGYLSSNGGDGSPGGTGGGGAAGGTPPSLSGGAADCGHTAVMDGYDGDLTAPPAPATSAILPSAGGVGSAGTIGGIGADASGFWLTGSQGGNGTAGDGGGGGAGAGGGGGDGSGFCFNTSGTGAGGGAGGGGGQGGTGGTGGFGGGSTYGIFIFNNGVNTNIIDCQIINGTAGAGGTGGTGGNGGNGGTGGTGGTSNNGEGNGGKGGDGAKGGKGGAGGTGNTGILATVKVVGGVALAQNTTLNMLTQPVIIADNIACTNINMIHTTSAATPAWDFGTGATPATGAGSPDTTQYSSLGRKDIVMNSNTYTGFNNILVTAPSTGTIVSSANTICPGSANFASSVGGTPGLTYLWTVSGSNATIATATLDTTSITFTNTGTAPIVDTITLTISSQCCGALTPLTKIITVYPLPAAPTATVAPVCIGGDATFTATSPVGSLFQWYSAASSGTLLGTGTTYTATNVSSTVTVYLQATNGGGCLSSLTPVSVTPTATSAPTPGPSTISCDIGNVDVSINPAAGVTDYNWYSDAAGTVLVQSGNSLTYTQFIATAGGTYTVYVQSIVQGCTSSNLIPITGSVSADPIILGAPVYIPNDTVCKNTSVQIWPNPTGGNSYTYVWSPSGSISGTLTQTFAASTSVSVTIKNSEGCSKIFYFPIIVKPFPFDSIVAPANLTCATTSVVLDGTHSATGANYTYSWTTNSGNITSATNTTSATVNAAADYYLKVTDISSGCFSYDTATVVTNNTPPTPLITATNSSFCAGDSTILSAATSTAGSGSINSYLWQLNGANINGANDTTYSASGAGSYTVILGNTNGCTATSSPMVITVNTLPSPVITGNAVICPGGSTTLSGTSSSAGSGNITSYQWLLNGNPIGGANSATLNVSTVGNYMLVIGNSNGCSDTTSSATAVTMGVLPTATITGTQTFCSGGSTILSASSSTAGSGSISTYQWQLNGSDIFGATAVTYSATAAGNYTVLVENTSTCNNTSSATMVTVIPTPTATAVTPVVINCVNPTATLDGTGSSAGATYAWTPIGGIVSGASSLMAVANQAGVYTLTVTLNGCSASTNVTVTATPDPVALISANPTSGIAPLTVDFVSNSQNANMYSWTFGNSTTSTIANPSTIYSTPGTYTAILTASENGACPSMDSLTIIVTEDYSIVIPNIFSPNGDGKNDVFIITTTGVKEFTAQIFDRWGLKMIEWSDKNAGWNGQSHGGKVAPEGTYYYTIKLTTEGGKNFDYQGYLLLVR